MPGVHRAGGTQGRAGKDKQREGAGVKPKHREEETDGFSGRGRGDRERLEQNRTEERLSSTLGGQGYFYLLFMMPQRPQRHYTASTARMDLLQG